MLQPTYPAAINCNKVLENLYMHKYSEVLLTQFSSKVTRLTWYSACSLFVALYLFLIGTHRSPQSSQEQHSLAVFTVTTAVQ
uniref:Uncharacterized protein n=1 Tax=Arion vulgaris TaxID=1028688 RepID=A0A0B7BN51_9EUPU